MAMLDIEYRFSGETIDAEGIRRKTTKDMEFYIRGLVFEMQSADISVKFRTAVPAEGERNMVYTLTRNVSFSPKSNIFLCSITPVSFS